MTADRTDNTVLVRATWDRPVWCHDDWCRVRLPSGVRYWSPNYLVRYAPADDAECWVRARLLGADPGGGPTVAVRYTDFDGVGCVDLVPESLVRDA